MPAESVNTARVVDAGVHAERLAGSRALLQSEQPLTEHAAPYPDHDQRHEPEDDRSEDEIGLRRRSR